MTGRRGLSAAVLLGLALAGPAWADPRDDARRHFVEGLAAAERQDFQAAIDAFLAAQAAWPHPSTVFNIARSYEDLGDPKEALRWYQRFVMDYPDRATEAQPSIDRLSVATAPPPEPTPQPPPTSADDGALSEADLQRLRSLGDELQRLLAGLPAHPDPSAPAEPGASRGAPPAAQEPPAAGHPSPFLTEAYERTVVSASRVGQAPLDSPSTITVISADDIRLSGATNIPDLLRTVAGVDVMSLSSASPSVGIRGFNSELSNKVLWLVDGRTVYWDFLAAPLPLNFSFSLDEIERIEVIRGPSSAVYGANAMTGVINIITRTPGQGPKALFRISGGHPDFIQGTALTSGTSGAFAWRLSTGYEQQGRWAKEGYPEQGGPLVPLTDDQDLASRRFRTHGRVDARFGEKGFASITGGYTRGFTEFYNIGALGDYAADGQTHNLRGDLAWDPVHLVLWWNHETATTAPWFQEREPPRDLSARVRNDVVLVEVEGTPSFNTGEVHHQVNVGAGYRYRSTSFDYLQGGYDQPWTEHHYHVFAQEQLRWRWLGVVASLRLDRHPLLPVSKTLSPRAALLFRVAPQTSLRVSGGTAYRAMNAVESYMDFKLNTAAPGFFLQDYGGQTNPTGQGLIPERIVTVEAGVHDQSSAWHQADVTVYWNRVTHLIGLDDVTPTLAPYDPDANGYPAGTTGWINRDEVFDAVGGEAELEVFPVDGLDAFANLSLERIFERDQGQTVVDGSTSLARVNLGASYRLAPATMPFKMDFTVAGSWLSRQAWRLREFDAQGQLVVDTRDVPARFILSARIAARPLKKPDLELALNLWNPVGFFQPFQEHPKGQPVGGRLFGTISLAL